MPALKTIIIRRDIRTSLWPSFSIVLREFRTVVTLQLVQFAANSVAELGRIILAFPSLKHLMLDVIFVPAQPADLFAPFSLPAQSAHHSIFMHVSLQTGLPVQRFGDM